MADVVGRRFGKSLRLPFNDKKSVAGSIAMFVSTILLSVGCGSVRSAQNSVEPPAPYEQ
jgi:dolichol kinase